MADPRVLALKERMARRTNSRYLPAVVGDNSGNIADPQRPGYIYVRELTSQGLSQPRSVLLPTYLPIQLFPGAPVKLGYDESDNYIVLSSDTLQNISLGVDPVSTIAQTPSPQVTQANFQTLIVVPANNPPNLSVSVRAWVIIASGTVTLFPGATQDMTSFVPSAGNMLYACIFVKNDYATLEVKTSTARSVTDVPLGVADIQQCVTARSSGSTPVWAIKLIGGQTSIALNDLLVDGQDLRQLVNFDAINSGGSGTVTSVAMTVPSFLSVAGSPITTSGTLAVTLATEAASTVFAGPASGAAATPTFRALVDTDLPILPQVFKVYVKAASTGNVTISGPGATLDGYSMVSGDRVLLKNQTTANQNGPWIFNGSAAALTRPTDFASGDTVLGFYGVTFEVLNGTTNIGTQWYLSTTGAITIDTTSIAFTQIVNNVTANAVTGILPLINGGTGANLNVTGGVHQFVKQSSAGAPFTVGPIAELDLPNGNAYDTVSEGTAGTPATQRTQLNFVDAEVVDNSGATRTDIYEDLPHIYQVRITPTSVTPVVTTNTTAVTTLFATPYKGGRASYFDGTALWTKIDHGEVSIKITDGSQTGTTSSTGATITGLTDTSQLVVGMEVSGTGVASGANILSVDSATQITMTKNGTANGSATITFKLPANTTHDIFEFNNSGAPKMEFTTWKRVTATNSPTSGANKVINVPDTSGVLVGQLVTVYTPGTASEYARVNTIVANTSITVDNLANSHTLPFVFYPARATALVLQDGVEAKSGVTTRRYIGTIQTTATAGQTEDSFGTAGARHFIWNRYNQVWRDFAVSDPASTWTYTGTTWRKANNADNMKFEFVYGLVENSVRATYWSIMTTSVATSTAALTSVGLDRVNASDAQAMGESSVASAMSAPAAYDAKPAIGYHFLEAVEEVAGTCTGTYHGAGNAQPTAMLGGLWG